ncbi:class I SAM-dependent methyltransferase [Solwaraspora sp. WMMA2065]|uniref:class I SAM-dependent methyltransferase n=1 Tax=Solwaraspora sp. WMMA2065 TaxID=3015166 RepID=UPI00259B1015|nr:class I SAM-dependent methyltransferase [Solwaraspora sp. WMMA2065]WJK33074.1 class I SAM-dependent methyltransferase [Solwaraspora sp. WMMA2065]
MTFEDPSPHWQDAETDLFLRFGDVFVPRRDEQVKAICALLAHLPDAAVLELGCGGGILTDAILAAEPDRSVTAVDASAAMIDAARQRLKAYGDRIRFCHADLAGTQWRTGAYGAVVTSLAVHHLDDGQKRSLLRSVRGLLRPGGVYVQCDLVLPATAASHELAARQWEAAVEEQSLTLYGSDAGLTAFRQARWNLYRHPDPADRPARLADHIGWLSAAGFTDVDVCWALAGHVILAATRPLEV